jgi:hypothetical protein
MPLYPVAKQSKRNNMENDRDYLNEAYLIAWGESLLLPEREHLQALIEHHNETLIRLEAVIKEG